MDRRLFSYHLPESRIAQAPLSERSAARMLVLPRHEGPWQDRMVRELPDLLQPGDLLVANASRVIPARLWARKPSGGEVEILVERLLSARLARVQLRVSKKPALGAHVILEDGSRLLLQAREGAFFDFSAETDWLELLTRMGHMPLPPYITREDDSQDRERYQTVYAERPGSVAAPTAGLHFDQALLDRVRARGVELAMVTLHIGAGTFQPMRHDDLDQHQMHAEWLEVSAEVVEKIKATRARGGRVIAIGTTTVRALESAASAGELMPYQGDTELFIRPGFQFKVVDALFTNFHLPESTLLVMISAFAGRERVLAAYEHAVQAEYRFFSYGDAMFLAPPQASP